MPPTTQNFVGLRIVLLCLIGAAVCVLGQQSPAAQAEAAINPTAFQTALSQISKGSERFSLELFKRLADAAPYDFVLSPFSVWSLLILTAEGAVGNTRRELETVLGLPEQLSSIRDGYKDIQRALKVNTTTIQLALTQVLFTDRNRPVTMEFEDIIQRVYKADHVLVNFNNVNEAYYTINDYVSNQTNGRLGNVVTTRDLSTPQMMLISAIYFKGLWEIPFEHSNTRSEPFYDETGLPLGNVDMMYQMGPFAYTNLPTINAHVLEMVYGVEKRLSIIFVLPKKGETLRNVIQLLQLAGIQSVLADLAKSRAEFEDDDVEVFLPRFTTRSDFALNGIMQSMGLRDIFQPSTADLSKISTEAYLARIIHKAQIEVNEEGTEASAATVGGFANKNSPPRFYANRPFAYMIVEKRTNLLLFCGQIKNPVLKKQ